MVEGVMMVRFKTDFMKIIMQGCTKHGKAAVRGYPAYTSPLPVCISSISIEGGMSCMHV